MIPRGKRNKIIIVVVILAVIVSLIACIYLYFTTDLFKSDRVLFAKYIEKAAQNVESLLDDEKGEEYYKSLESNKYISNTEFYAKYRNSAGSGTTLSNNDNVLNTLKLVVKGKTDKANALDYKNIRLQQNDDWVIAELDYLKSNQKYGIRFTELFDKYLSVENRDLKQVATKLNVDEQVPNSIGDMSLVKDLRFSDDDLEDLNNEYKDIIIDKFEKGNFTDLKKTSITVQNADIETNAYTLKLTKEQLNDMYVSILEQMKNDEILLGKVDLLDQIFNPELVQTEGENSAESENVEENNVDGEEANSENEDLEDNMTVREKYVKKIDDIITDIKNKNIGNDESSITVYESNGSTVKTVISTTEYEMILETLMDTNSSDSYVRFFKRIKNVVDVDEDEIAIEKNENNIYVNRNRIIGEEKYKTSFAFERKIENGKQDVGLKLDYDMGKNRIEINVIDRKEVVTGFDETEDFTDGNNVVLNDLTDDEYAEIKDQLKEKGIGKLQSVSEQVNVDEVLSALYELGILSKKLTVENIVTLTKSEVSKFNTEFEMYKGENVSADVVKEMLEIAKNNLETVEVLSDSTIRLNIVRGKQNEELVSKVKEIVNGNSSKGFTIDYEYDEETKMIKSVLIKMLENV